MASKGRSVARKAAQEGSWDTAIEPDGETRKQVPEAVARRVWIAAGGRCTFCGRNLVTDETTGKPVLIGQLAHIVGATKGKKSPRGLFPFPMRRRHQAENLVLLCYDQHHVIDDKSMWEVYSVEDLRRLKAEHEDRMRRVTSMGIERSSTVLRLVGDVGVVPVDLSDDAVEEALLERGLFPDYKLRELGDPFEIDVRGYPGASAGSSNYWQAAAEKIEEKVAELRQGVTAGLLKKVSVLAMARIPLLVALGKELGEAGRVELYPARKSGTGGFGWSPEQSPTHFEAPQVQAGTDPTKVAVIVSVTGSVDRSAAGVHLDSAWTIYELRPAGVAPTSGLDRSQATIDNFRTVWAQLLADLELVPNLTSVALFPAVPVTFAITLGRCLVRGRSPALMVYDLADGQYHLALEVAR